MIDFGHHVERRNELNIFWDAAKQLRWIDDAGNLIGIRVNNKNSCWIP